MWVCITLVNVVYSPTSAKSVDLSLTLGLLKSSVLAWILFLCMWRLALKVEMREQSEQFLPSPQAVYGTGSGWEGGATINDSS